MGEACVIVWTKKVRKVCQNCSRKKSVGRTTREWQVAIDVDLRQQEYENVAWIRLAYNRAQ
jgi:hypothetical protein